MRARVGDDVVAVARGGAAVVLGDEAAERLTRVRTIVDGIVARNDVVYGITTGFGKLSDVAIPPDRLAELQVNLVTGSSASLELMTSVPWRSTPGDDAYAGAE